MERINIFASIIHGFVVAYITPGQLNNRVLSSATGQSLRQHPFYDKKDFIQRTNITVIGLTSPFSYTKHRTSQDKQCMASNYIECGTHLRFLGFVAVGAAFWGRILRSIPRLKYFCQALSSSSSYRYVKKLPPPLVRKLFDLRARPCLLLLWPRPARPNHSRDERSRPFPPERRCPTSVRQFSLLLQP